MSRLLALGALLVVLAACADDAPQGDPVLAEGRRVFRAQCASCHQPSGAGIGAAYPSLLGTDWVTGDVHRLVRLVLHGVEGPMEVDGRTYDNVMPPYAFLSDDEVAALLTYVRRGLAGNDATPVTASLVASVRAEGEPPGLWQASVLRTRTGPGTAPDTAAAPASPAPAPAHAAGEAVYTARCLACHQADGGGVDGLYPPLQDTDWVAGDPGRLIRLLLAGLSGPIEVHGVTYNNVMPPHAFLSDDDLAAVVSYVRDRFADAPPVTAADVAAVRARLDRTRPWTVETLRDATGIPAP